MQQLDLSDDLIYSIPNILNENLEYINLSGNSFISIPIIKKSKLGLQVDCSRNKFKDSIDLGIVSENIEYLSLSSNRIRFVCCSKVNFGLKFLEISRNWDLNLLVDSSITNLTNLLSIKISDNQIENLKIITKIATLDEIIIVGNVDKKKIKDFKGIKIRVIQEYL